jgi:hypothetical protein
MDDWERIRKHFTQEEKDLLNKATIATAVCPKGLVVDDDQALAVVHKVKILLNISY